MLRVFSLKSKIIMLSFSVGLTVAAFLLFMAYQFFKNDKLAYIFDSNETQLETIASEIRNEVSSKNEEIRLYTRQFNLKLLQGYSLPDTSDIEAVIFFEQGAVSKKELGAIYKKNLSEEAKKKTKNFENQKKVDNKISFSNTHVEIVEQNQVADRKFGVFYIYQSNAIAKIRQLGKEVAFVLTNSQSEVILSLTQNQREITLDRAIISQGLFINESLTQLTSQSRIIETNEGSILLSSAKLGLNDFYIVSAIPESIALKSFSTLFYRAILFFIFISSLIFAIFYLLDN